jgi:hypothetical protein
MKALDTTSRYFPGYTLLSFKEPSENAVEGMPYNNNALRNCSVQQLWITQSLYLDNEDEVGPCLSMLFLMQN